MQERLGRLGCASLARHAELTIRFRRAGCAGPIAIENLFGSIEPVSGKRLPATACVLGENAEDEGAARRRWGDRIRRHVEPGQRLLRADQRRQRAAHHRFELDELLATDGDAAAT